MLDYLDGLCAALLARNGTEIRRLLRHPLARALPRRVREEGYAIARAGPESLRAPVQTLHFYHPTLHLLGARPTPPPGRRGLHAPPGAPRRRRRTDRDATAGDRRLIRPRRRPAPEHAPRDRRVVARDAEELRHQRLLRLPLDLLHHQGRPIAAAR